MISNGVSSGKSPAAYRRLHTATNSFFATITDSPRILCKPLAAKNSKNFLRADTVSQDRANKHKKRSHA